MSPQEKAKYDLSGAKIYNFTPEVQGSNIVSGETVKDNIFIGTQHNYALEQKQNLAEAAAEIQAILDQLSQTYPTNTITGKKAIAIRAIEEIENHPSLAERVVSALKAGGVAALEQMLNHPAASFFIGALEDWKGTREG